MSSSISLARPLKPAAQETSPELSNSSTPPLTARTFDARTAVAKPWSTVSAESPIDTPEISNLVAWGANSHTAWTVRATTICLKLSWRNGTGILTILGLAGYGGYHISCMSVIGHCGEEAENEDELHHFVVGVIWWMLQSSNVLRSLEWCCSWSSGALI